MATLKDVAKISGVSVGTASAVFNNKPWVKEEARQKVIRAAKELNYQPNILARSLKTRKSNTIGVVVSDITNPFFPEIFISLENYARLQDFSLLLGNTNKNSEEGVKVFKSLVNNQVEGIILIGRGVPEAEIIESFSQRSFPVVAIEGNYFSSEISTINADSILGGFNATMHLLNKGYWPVAFIGGPDSQKCGSGRGRLSGYLNALKEYQKGVDPCWIRTGDFHFNGGYKAMARMLEEEILPRAVFAANDLMAIGAMAAAKDKGLEIPGDIAFVGYDNIPFSLYASPPLSTVPLPKREMGRLAFELLHHYLENPSEDRRRLVMPPDKIIIRESCGGR